MILSKRERYCTIGAVSVVALLVLDRYVLTPLTDMRKQIDADTSLVKFELNHNTKTFNTRDTLEKEWAGMLQAGLKADASNAEMQILQDVQAWAQESRLNLSSLKPERTETDRQFQKKTIRATGMGNTEAVKRFLYKVRTAIHPLRISDITITSRREGNDDLSLQIGISTLYLAPEKPEKPEKPERAAPTNREQKE